MENLKEDRASSSVKGNALDHIPDNKALTIVKQKDNSYDLLKRVWGNGTSGRSCQTEAYNINHGSEFNQFKTSAITKRQNVTGASNKNQKQDRKLKVDNITKLNSCTTNTTPAEQNNNIEEQNVYENEKLGEINQDYCLDTGKERESQTFKPNVTHYHTEENNKETPNRLDNQELSTRSYNHQSGKDIVDKGRHNIEINIHGKPDINETNSNCKESDERDKISDVGVSAINYIDNLSDSCQERLENTDHRILDTKTKKKERISDANRYEKEFSISRVVKLNYNERHIIKENYADGGIIGSHIMESRYIYNNRTEQPYLKSNADEQNKAHRSIETTTGICIKIEGDVGNELQLSDENETKQTTGNGFTSKDKRDHRSTAESKDYPGNEVQVKSLYSNVNLSKGLEIANQFTNRSKNQNNKRRYVGGFGQTRSNRSCGHTDIKSGLSKSRQVSAQTVSGSKGQRCEEDNSVSSLRQHDSKWDQINASESEGHGSIDKTNAPGQRQSEIDNGQANNLGSKGYRNTDELNKRRCSDGTVFIDKSETGDYRCKPDCISGPVQYQRDTEYVQNKISFSRQSDRNASNYTSQTSKYVHTSIPSSRLINKCSDNSSSRNNTQSSADDQNATIRDGRDDVKESNPDTEKFDATVLQGTSQCQHYENNVFDCVAGKKCENAEHVFHSTMQHYSNNDYNCETETNSKMIDHGLSEFEPLTDIINNQDENQKMAKNIKIKLKQTVFQNLFRRKGGSNTESVQCRNQKITLYNGPEDIEFKQDTKLNIDSIPRTIIQDQTYLNENPTTSDESINTKMVPNENLLPTVNAEMNTKDITSPSTEKPNVKDQINSNSCYNVEEWKTRATTSDQIYVKDSNTRNSFNEGSIDGSQKDRDIITYPYPNHHSKVENEKPLSKSNAGENRKYLSRTSTRKPAFGNRDSKPVRNVYEEAQLLKFLAKSTGFIVHDVQGDGNCMYRSVIDQLRIQGVFDLTAERLRHLAVEYLRDNPYHEDGTHLKAFLPTENWDNYLERMRLDGEWGDQLMLRGISEVTNRKVCIISVVGSSHNQTTIQPGKAETDQSESIFLGHINDFHYVSLRPKDWLDKCFVNADKRAGVLEEHDLVDGCLATGNNQEPFSVTFPSTDECVDKVTGWPFPHLTYIVAVCVREPAYNNHARERRAIQEQFSIGTTVTFSRDWEHMGFVDFKSGYNQERTLVYISPNIPYFVTFDERTINENTRYLATEIAAHPGICRLKPVHKEESLLDNVNKSNVDQYDLQQFWQNVRHRRRPKTTSVEIYCVATDKWPDCALKWKDYRRPSGWPDSGLINEIFDAGCLITPSKHANGDLIELVWRVDFANAEEKLMSSITRSQSYCLYVFKELVRFCLGFHVTFLHVFLETVFFHACENIPVIHWQERKGQCILYLIDNLLLSLKKRCLPHYFVRDINVYRMLDKTTLEKFVRSISRLRRYTHIAAILFFENNGRRRDNLFDPVIEDARKFTNPIHSQSFVTWKSSSAIRGKLQKTFRGQERSGLDNLPGSIYRDSQTSEDENLSVCEKLQKSVTTIILPSFISLIKDLLLFSSYRCATGCLIDAFSCGKLVQITEETIITDLGIDKMKEFWISLFMDYYYSTSMLSHFTANYADCTSIGEIVKDEYTLGVFHDFKVPLNLVSCGIDLQDHGCQLYVAGLLFLPVFCNTLIDEARIAGGGLFKECQPYLRFLIQHIKQFLSVLKSPDTPTIDYGEIDHPEIHRKQSQISEMKRYLRDGLEQLYTCYEEEGVDELFYEYVNDYEELCDEAQSIILYQNLARVWMHLGEKQKYLATIDKIQVLISTSSPNAKDNKH